jgi:CPA2 family monovalent cation:H+ antiporter-2
VSGAAEAIDPAWIKDVFIFLGAAGIVVPLFHRARFGAVFGFLVVGVIVGPFGLGRFTQHHPWIDFLTIDDPQRVTPFAELGVIFLLFLFGLELSFERLWQMRRYLLGVGALQVGVSALAIGSTAFLLGVKRDAAIVLGLCLAMSSTAIVMQLLREQNRLGTQLGRLAFSILLFQDLMVVPILFITGVLGSGVGDGILLSLVSAIAQAAVAIAAIMVVGRYVLQPMLRFVAATGSRDLIMAITVLIVVAAAGVTGAAGLSTALGAFLAGLLLGETEHRHQINVDLEPFKGLLLGLFFVTVGMTIDLRFVAAYAHYIVVGVLSLLVVKASILLVAARALGVARGVAIEDAILLAGGGEFALVVISLARGNGLLDSELAQIVTMVVGITMILTPVLAFLAHRLGATAQYLDEAKTEIPRDAEELQAEVVIVGFGRVGQSIAAILKRKGISYVAVDQDSALVARERKKGHAVYLGDGRRPEILDRVGVENAAALAATLADIDGAEHIVATSSRHWPDVPVCARARDREHAARLRSLGATVVLEAFEPSLQLAGRVLEKLGYTEDKVGETLAEAREIEIAAIAAGKPEKPRRRKRVSET